MVMVADFAPGLKRFFKPAALRGALQFLVFRMVIAFPLHSGRMSCLAAAGAIQSEPVDRAQMTRFLRRPRWRGRDINGLLIRGLLESEPRQEKYLFLLDATLCAHAGRKTENTLSTGNRKRRPRKGRRYGKYKHARKSCHSFTMGLSTWSRQTLRLAPGRGRVVLAALADRGLLRNSLAPEYRAAS
jgi:hypothetical protein